MLSQHHKYLLFVICAQPLSNLPIGLSCIFKGYTVLFANAERDGNHPNPPLHSVILHYAPVSGTHPESQLHHVTVHYAPHPHKAETWNGSNINKLLNSAASEVAKSVRSDELAEPSRQLEEADEISSHPSEKLLPGGITITTHGGSQSPPYAMYPPMYPMYPPPYGMPGMGGMGGSGVSIHISKNETASEILKKALGKEWAKETIANHVANHVVNEIEHSATLGQGSLKEKQTHLPAPHSRPVRDSSHHLDSVEQDLKRLSDAIEEKTVHALRESIKASDLLGLAENDPVRNKAKELLKKLLKEEENIYGGSAGRQTTHISQSPTPLNRFRTSEEEQEFEYDEGRRGVNNADLDTSLLSQGSASRSLDSTMPFFHHKEDIEHFKKTYDTEADELANTAANVHDNTQKAINKVLDLHDRLNDWKLENLKHINVLGELNTKVEEVLSAAKDQFNMEHIESMRKWELINNEIKRRKAEINTSAYDDDRYMIPPTQLEIWRKEKEHKDFS